MNCNNELFVDLFAMDITSILDKMELELFEANNGNCPYLENRQWHSYTFRADKLENRVYESLIAMGFRRSGNYFYKNNCPSCEECVSIRLRVDQFLPSKSQKRVWKKNQDLKVSWHAAEFDEEGFLLYQRYSQTKHQTQTSEKTYRDFLINTAVHTIMMRYSLGSKLIAIGWVDLLHNSLSSVYFAYEAEFSKRSLGVFSVLKEVELAEQLNKTFLHLGFWVKNCQTMSYKQQYQPHELLLNGVWVGNRAETDSDN